VAALDAAAGQVEKAGVVTITDPPYYDNVGYADLSDFFYLWLRRGLADIYPSLFETVLTPKRRELIAARHRFEGSTKRAEEHFLQGLERVFKLTRQRSVKEYPTSFFYAYKQTATRGGSARGPAPATGWETMLQALLGAGFQITATLPMRTEQQSGFRAHNQNSLASSIVLVCRPRRDDAGTTTRRGFLTQLRRELPSALRAMQQSHISPADLAQANVGPGMAVFSQYAAVLDADGSPMSIRTALQIINEELDAYFAEQDGDLDEVTRFCAAWFEQHGYNEAAFGEADVLARAKNISVDRIAGTGILAAGRGRVRLLRRQEYGSDWSPASQATSVVWECTQRLARCVEPGADAGGEEAAARLFAQLPSSVSESARALAYRLFSVCERKNWAEEALAYNTLVNSWSDIQRLAADLPRDEAQQTTGL
jgi:putative DNA methylase